MNLKLDLHIAFLVVYGLLSVLGSIHVIFYKRQPASAILWLLNIWIFPILGFVIYWYFGFNRVFDDPRELPYSERFAGASRSPLERLGRKLTGLPLHPTCKVDLLQDGVRAYPRMLRSIHLAEERIDLLTYIFDYDKVGETFANALARAARRGVKVRVLVDGVGAWSLFSVLKRRLKSAGVEFLPFWRSDQVFHQPMLNLRNHRKLLVIDRKEAYLGSLNISERHYKGPLSMRTLRDFSGVKGSRDTHFRVRGQVVNDLVALFEHDWDAAGGRAEELLAIPQRHAGGDRVRVVRSGPDREYERIYELLLGALRFSKRSVDLCTPYFIPDAALMACLRSLALSGVRVRLFLPRHGDQALVAWASRAYFRELLAAGVEVWLIEGSFVHSKVCVIDGHWCLIGSCNLDIRSFRLNFELNLEVHSTRLAADIGGVLEEYRLRSLKLSLARFRNFGFSGRFIANVARLFSPFL